MKQLIRTSLLFTLLTAFLFLITSFVAAGLPKTFSELLDRANMAFVNPDSLVSTPVLYNRACIYEYAVKYPDKNFEVRYCIRPSDNLWKEYELNKKSLKKGDIETNPDSTYLWKFETIISNISGSLPKITEFDKTSVKNEFNADWGGTVAFQPKGEFGQNYKYCMIIALHKSHQGDAYIFYLSDSPEGFNELMAPAFHSLKFR